MPVGEFSRLQHELLFEPYPPQLIASGLARLKSSSLPISLIPLSSHPPVAGVAQASVHDTLKPSSPLLVVPPVAAFQKFPTLASMIRAAAASARPQATSRGVLRPLPLQDAAATYGTIRSTRSAAVTFLIRQHFSVPPLFPLLLSWILFFTAPTGAGAAWTSWPPAADTS